MSKFETLSKKKLSNILPRNHEKNLQSFQRGELKRARLMIPVASMYLSTQREMQLFSPPLRLVPGFVTHFAKHLLPTVCHIVQKRINGIINRSLTELFLKTNPTWVLKKTCKSILYRKNRFFIKRINLGSIVLEVLETMLSPAILAIPRTMVVES
jgi:hypothetical protein